jgi:hypothetical protein
LILTVVEVSGYFVDSLAILRAHCVPPANFSFGVSGIDRHKHKEAKYEVGFQLAVHVGSLSKKAIMIGYLVA